MYGFMKCTERTHSTNWCIFSYSAIDSENQWIYDMLMKLCSFLSNIYISPHLQAIIGSVAYVIVRSKCLIYSVGMQTNVNPVNLFSAFSFYDFLIGCCFLKRVMIVSHCFWQGTFFLLRLNCLTFWFISWFRACCSVIIL